MFGVRGAVTPITTEKNKKTLKNFFQNKKTNLSQKPIDTLATLCYYGGSKEVSK
jgi:menaquinone-dependent protoporphyrinogen IX oxidase